MCKNCDKEKIFIRSGILGDFCSQSCFMAFKQRMRLIPIHGMPLKEETKEKIRQKRKEYIAKGNYFVRPRLRSEKKNCLICGIEFESKIVAKRKYCSLKCAQTAQIDRPTWNTGLRKETDGRLKKQSDNLKQTIEKLGGNPSSGFTGHKHKEESKEQIGETFKTTLQNNPDILRKMIISTSKANSNHPNRKEKILQSLLENIDNHFRYVGDGSFAIGGRNPDFVNRERQQIIEFNGCYWHNCQECKGNYLDVFSDDERILYFAKYGYDTLIIWEHELENLGELKEKILSFVGQIADFHKTIDFDFSQE